jgi:hypothetical protein
METLVIIERGLDGTFSAYLADDMLPYGIIGDGDTVQSTISDFYDAYNDMRRYYAEQGEPFVETNFVFKYDLPSFLQYYAYAFTLAGLERITGVNQRQLSHYINGTSKPSEKTVRKIEDKIHAFGEEIASVHFV